MQAIRALSFMLYLQLHSAGVEPGPHEKCVHLRMP